MTNALVEKKRAYREYQYRLGKEYVVPLLKEWQIPIADSYVLDIGCAEGGVLCALAEEGACSLGFDIIPSRLFFAVQFAQPLHLQKVKFIAADFFMSPIKKGALTFDLILLRDVIEHLADKNKVMEILTEIAADKTKFFITFPPFYAPFGGHQQMLKRFLRFVPYFHALPTPIWAMFRWWIKRFDGNPNFVKEMDKLRAHRTSIGGFRKLVKRLGYKIIAEKFYLSRPSYHLRYGWPVISSKILSRIPVLSELAISGAFFALAREK